MRLHVLSYNVRGLPWISCPITSILKWAKMKTNPDILCLQEVFTQSLGSKIIDICGYLGYDVYFPENMSNLSQRIVGFQNPSGLCTLVRSDFFERTTPLFKEYESCDGVDAFVRKGFFLLNLEKNGKVFQIVNTHLQSDFTEFPCCRFNYHDTRNLQENQLYQCIKLYPLPLLFGDFNRENFHYFEKFSDEFHITFPQTEEMLDFMLIHRPISNQIKNRSVIYFDDIHMSDHIPVLFKFEL